MLSLSRFRDPSPQGNCLHVHSHWSDRRTQFTSVHSSQPFGRVTRCDRISNYRDSRSTYRSPDVRCSCQISSLPAPHDRRHESEVKHIWQQDPLGITCGTSYATHGCIIYELAACVGGNRSTSATVADDCCQCRTHSDDDVMLWHHRSSLCT